MATSPVPSITAHLSGEWTIAKILEYPVGFALARHYHDDACIQIVLRGEFHEDGWRECQVFAMGESLFRPAGFDHANVAMNRVSTGLSLQLNAAAAPEPIAERIKRATPMKMHDPYVGLLAARITGEMAAPDSFSPTVIDALCADLVVRMLRRGDGEADDASLRLADEAADFIRNRIDGPLSIESVAQAMGTDRFRLNRAFLKHHGTSPAEFMRLLRVEKAQRLLIGTEEPIAVIALMCGFADQSHLTKSFQAIVGMSPARFRTRRKT